MRRHFMDTEYYFSVIIDPRRPVWHCLCPNCN